MIPNRMQINALFNNGKTECNFKRLGILSKYKHKNNIADDNQAYVPNEGFLKPKSPILLKRSSLIKYDDFIPFADGTEDINRKNKEDKIEKYEKQPMSSLFKTGSISSLKISSLKEQWPSSEYVQSGRCKVRTQSTCNEHRCPLPSAASNGSVSEHSASMAIRTVGSLSSHSNLNVSLSTDKSALASCLSKCDDRSKLAAVDIMKRMDFTDLSLVESLQTFIKRIPVIGESQERDRILTYFTDRFMECNPTSFKNSDACHTLVCALMLLNTDIHGQVSKKRMTCKEFVDNILTNYPDNDYKENDLTNVYGFIRKTELKNEDSIDGTNTLRRKFTKLISKSIKSPPEVINVNIDSNLLNQQHFISGNIMRKCIKRSFGKKPALGHRGWKLQFASLIGLQLLLFKTNLNKTDGRSEADDFNGDRISLTDSNISSELLQNDNSSLCMSITNSHNNNTNTTKSVNSKLASSCSRDNVHVSVDDIESCIKIHHAYASVVEKLRHKNVFSLRLADQAEYFFKVKSGQLQTWVNNVNYAAAILSASPIVGAGQCGLYKPLLPGYLTDLDKTKQIESHETEIRHYRENLKKLQLVNSKTRAVNEDNIQFCKYEILRFETYVTLLTCPSSSVDSVLPLDLVSVVSTIELSQPHPSLVTTMSASPRSAMYTSVTGPESGSPSPQDMTTLRRRPPKMPSVSISRLIAIPSPISPSSHTSNHNQIVTTISQSPRPVTYSPQISSHPLMSNQIGVRPTPSFSRFVDPSSLSSSPVPDIGSPLVTARSQYQSDNSNKLPHYSPPASSVSSFSFQHNGTNQL